jgi:hypothetical protein
MGSFSVMRPPPRPTADNSQPVTRPELKAKILAAREILGRDVVTDDDLWRLEREGRFAGLGLGAGSPEGAAATTNGSANGKAAANAPPSRVAAAPPSMPDPSVPTQGPPVPTGVTPPPAVTSVADMPAPSK